MPEHNKTTKRWLRVFLPSFCSPFWFYGFCKGVVWLYGSCGPTNAPPPTLCLLPVWYSTSSNESRHLPGWILWRSHRHCYFSCLDSWHGIQFPPFPEPWNGVGGTVNSSSSDTNGITKGGDRSVRQQAEKSHQKKKNWSNQKRRIPPLVTTTATIRTHKVTQLSLCCINGERWRLRSSCNLEKGMWWGERLYNFPIERSICVVNVLMKTFFHIFRLHPPDTNISNKQQATTSK